MDITSFWETIVNTLHDGLLVVDARGTILNVNPAAEKLTGYRAEELVGQNCRILNCTGCQIYGRGSGEDWCSLYVRQRVRAKRCTITDKNGRALNIMKNASVLKDDNGQVVGAIETLTDISEIVRQEQEIISLRQSCHLDDDFHGIIGHSPPMQTLFELIDNVARSDAPVMIHGPSGTGKELAARAVHEAGPRRGKPFIKVNCAALNANLLESELFGHVKGAYTGAERMRIGRFEAADEGTIFLDEIGDIPLATQVKLLRVLEEKEIERVGDHKPIRIDVRIISATNKHLEDLIAQGAFREDLFFRINVFPLNMPPLSARSDDLPLLVQHFITLNNARGTKQINGLTPGAMDMLLAYPWPGNVRELRNAVEYAFVLCPGGWIEPAHLPPRLAAPRTTAARPVLPGAGADGRRDKLLAALRACGGNQSQAAQQLNVSRVTIWKWIKKYGIDLANDV
ncbi:MAG: sigma 54-interacting transcriptional regulator [Desulfobacterales bacterium]|nr:sigma 54-interacting transcriptional regulator [Desulfobacterales bacterium]